MITSLIFLDSIVLLSKFIDSIKVSKPLILLNLPKNNIKSDFIPYFSLKSKFGDFVISKFIPLGITTIFDSSQNSRNIFFS